MLSYVLHPGGSSAYIEVFWRNYQTETCSVIVGHRMIYIYIYIFIYLFNVVLCIASG
jgi:hypothetical protein